MNTVRGLCIALTYYCIFFLFFVGVVVFFLFFFGGGKGCGLVLVSRDFNNSELLFLDQESQKERISKDFAATQFYNRKYRN